MREHDLPNGLPPANTRRETDDADLGLLIFASIERIRTRLAIERERQQAVRPAVR